MAIIVLFLPVFSLFLLFFFFIFLLLESKLFPTREQCISLFVESSVLVGQGACLDLLPTPSTFCLHCFVSLPEYRNKREEMEEKHRYNTVQNMFSIYGGGETRFQFLVEE